MKLRSIKNVLKREFKRFFTSSDLLLVCLAAPIFYGLLFSYLYINKRAANIEVGIVNMDNSRVSRLLTRVIDSSPELQTVKSYTSANEAYTDIFFNNLGALYFIPEDFTSNLKKGKTTVVFDAANSSNFLVSSTVLKKLTLLSAGFPQDAFVKQLVSKGYSYKAAQSAFTPLRTDSRYIFNSQMNYSDFFLPCLLFAVLQQILLVAVGTTISTEKSKNTQDDLYRTARGSFLAMFLGKAIPYILIGSFLNIINIFVFLPINAIYAHSIVGLLIVSTAFIIAVVFFAILISAFFDSPEMAMVVLMFYSLPTVLLSGFSWPHHALPLFLKIASLFFPSTYALNYLRLFTLGNISIRFAVAPTIALLIFASICYLLARWSENKTYKVFKTYKTIRG